MQVQAGQAGAGYSLLLEAARKSGDSEVYRRAVNIALHSRSGDAALEAARAWSQRHPEATEPLKAVLQILLAMGRIEESGEWLSRLLERTPADDRNDLLTLTGQTYSRLADKASAERTVTARLRTWMETPDTAPVAWAATGKVQLAAGMKASALAAARQSLQKSSTPAAVSLLADLLQEEGRNTEALIQEHLARLPDDNLLRLAYTRHLANTDRLGEALTHLTHITQSRPELAEAWLLQGLIQAQTQHGDAAQHSLERYLDLAGQQPEDAARKGRTQAYLALSQIAETRQQWDQALKWLDPIEPGDDVLRLQVRRASLTARQGQLTQARELIQRIPEREPSDVRTKLLAEVQLLKDNGQLEEARLVLDHAVRALPADPDLQYELAMVAEKQGLFPEMERILRQIIRDQPDYHHAHNALGYAMADRNERLPEARALIARALELAPGDPFITDSLGWVEFRLGNLDRAEELLQQALAKRPDAEIATHLGEVLWHRQRHPQALDMFRRARELQGDNATLRDTLRRLGVKL
jgi:tetratricopeptide (TPR) repeat protein